MARNKTNSEILEAHDPEPVYERLYNNALGKLDPPLNQNELISINAILDRYMPKVKLVDVTTGGEQLPAYHYHQPKDD